MRITTICKTKIDLVNNDIYTQFVTILSISSQYIELKPNFDINQGPKLCCKFAKNIIPIIFIIDLVNDNEYAKFGLNVSIHSQYIEQKPNFDVNQGP